MFVPHYCEIFVLFCWTNSFSFKRNEEELMTVTSNHKQSFTDWSCSQTGLFQMRGCVSVFLYCSLMKVICALILDQVSGNRGVTWVAAHVEMESATSWAPTCCRFHISNIKIMVEINEKNIVIFTIIKFIQLLCFKYKLIFSSML